MASQTVEDAKNGGGPILTNPTGEIASTALADIGNTTVKQEANNVESKIGVSEAAVGMARESGAEQIANQSTECESPRPEEAPAATISSDLGTVDAPEVAST